MHARAACSFGPILFKQIPYTMAKFVVFERVSEQVYAGMSTPKESLTSGQVRRLT